jgi:hypothetical protein
MKKNSRDRRFEGQDSRFKISSPTLFLKVLLFLATCLVIFSFVAGCKKKDEAQPHPPVVEQKALESIPLPAGEQKAPSLDPSQPQKQGPSYHSILTKDLNHPIPITSFSKSDRIYLLTNWTGLQGPHEIKVLWIRPDKTVQETVRFKDNISSKSLNYSSWAYLAFKKGLLNISPLEGKFIGSWKAQLFLDGKLLEDYDFSVF